MGMLREGAGWCLCAGGGKSERIKGAIFSGKGPALAAISSVPGGGCGTGFLIHRGLLLTTHANIPTVAAAEAVEIRLHHGRVSARLVPHRFFITSSVLDLSIVGLDTIDADSSSQGQQPHSLKPCCNPSLDLGSLVYVLGHTNKMDLTVGEGKVVIATDNLIKLSTDGMTWCPGSAGFDAQGNLAFMVCDPMKLASSPTARSSSASSSSSLSWKKDSSMQFGIPIPIIFDWLHQHWEGSLDELSKPKLPLIRLLSTGQKSEHSCTSFTQRRVFKSSEEDNDDISSSPQVISRTRCQPGPSNSPNAVANQENLVVDLRSAHEQGIPTPEIYESPRLTSGPLRKKENTSNHLLDINFPPRNPRSIALPLPLKQLLPDPKENNAEEAKQQKPVVEGRHASHEIPESNDGQNPPTLPADSTLFDCCSEVQSSSSPVEVLDLQMYGDGFSSEGETMYSAETMESRNYPSPKQNNLQQVGRSQSCVNYSRWTTSSRNSAARKGNLQKQNTFIPLRKTYSQTPAAPQRSHDYYSPTVSSNMKKRNNQEQSRKPRQREVQVSPRWMF
ncbi:Peptidase S1 PA clan protein [Dioscorea alata]|uniref:Peptidase S1 PA clan protein n=1 Tax=Dioscorea alata TaxID=55571 RepID=A0ACB7WAK4_DIOAL|nr:Peptidase S1 PA clan protein [Dioscorea alata]